MSNLCQPPCCPPQNMFRYLNYSGQAFGIISWLLWEPLAFPFLLFYLFLNNTEVPGQEWWQTASLVLRQSVLELAVAVAMQWGLCPRDMRWEFRGCASNFPLYRGTHPLGNRPHLPGRASWKWVVELAVLNKGRYCGTAGDRDIIISLLRPPFIW